MLLWILGCLPVAERPITTFHDDAGFLVAELRARGCGARAPCAIWDAGLFTGGPQVIGLGRPCPAGCATPARHVRVLGRAFDGVTGVLSPENPLLVELHALGCTTRDACHAVYERGTLTLIDRHGGGTSQVPGE